MSNVALLKLVETSVRACVAEARIEEARAVVVGFDEISWGNTDELRRSVDVFKAVGLIGRALSVIERHRGGLPCNSDDVLTTIEIEIYLRPRNSRTVPAALSLFSSGTVQQRVRVAALWRALGMHDVAVKELEVALNSDTTYLDVYRLLIDSLNWINRHKRAKSLLIKLSKIAPDEPAWSSFIAQQASRAGDVHLFRSAALRAEPKLAAGDDDARLRLAEAFSVYRDSTGVNRVLLGWNLEDIRVEWLLERVLNLTELHSLPHHQLTVARRAMALGGLKPLFFQKCNDIVQSYGAFRLGEK